VVRYKFNPLISTSLDLAAVNKLLLYQPPIPFSKYFPPKIPSPPFYWGLSVITFNFVISWHFQSIAQDKFLLFP